MEHQRVLRRSCAYVLYRGQRIAGALLFCSRRSMRTWNDISIHVLRCMPLPNRMELRDKPSAGEFEAGEHIIAKEIVMTDFLRGSEMRCLTRSSSHKGCLSRPWHLLCSQPNDPVCRPHQQGTTSSSASRTRAIGSSGRSWSGHGP